MHVETLIVKMKGIELKGIIVRAQISSDRCQKQKFIERSREEKKMGQRS
jgi:hypothetical protein